jgi:nucleotide-binding universal stress UspA family protein
VACADSLDPASAGTLAYAYLLAHQFGAHFSLFHVRGYKENGQNHDNDWERFEHAFKQQVPADLLPNPALLTLLSNDSPGTKIADYAKRRSADLIVMGAHTASASATHFAHGPASYVFAEAPCLVITLHKFVPQNDSRLISWSWM